jgi:hypothetical protein
VQPVAHSCPGSDTLHLNITVPAAGHVRVCIMRIRFYCISEHTIGVTTCGKRTWSTVLELLDRRLHKAHFSEDIAQLAAKAVVNESLALSFSPLRSP